MRIAKRVKFGQPPPYVDHQSAKRIKGSKESADSECIHMENKVNDMVSQAGLQATWIGTIGLEFELPSLSLNHQAAQSNLSGLVWLV